MTWQEICKQYAGQWVLIEYQALDEQLNVIEGEVIAHSPDKDVNSSKRAFLNGLDRHAFQR